MPPLLHGLSPASDLHQVARHEAGHLVIYWLLGRIVAGACAEEGGGMTFQVTEPGVKEMPHEHLLASLAGMAGEANLQIYDELYEHITAPTWFDPITDSYHAALAISKLPGSPQDNLRAYHGIVRRLLRRCSVAHHQAIRLLERGRIGLKECYDLFGEWDVRFGFTKRPKSDMLCRTIARAMRYRVPRDGFLGYDFKPLPDGWAYTRPTLLEVAEKCKAAVEKSKGHEH